MLHHERLLRPVSISSREVVAAWAGCIVVALGAYMATAASSRDDSCAAQVGVHIPGRGVVTIRDNAIPDPFDDEADKATKVASNTDKPALPWRTASIEESCELQALQMDGRISD